VTLLGALPHDRWLEVLSASDILFLPSQYEGISVALFEAMAMGVVPVMSAVGGQSELVTPECGVLIPLTGHETREYVTALRELIKNPQVREAMAQASRHRITQFFTLGQTISHLEAILDRARALGRSAPRPPVSFGLGRELATLAVEYARLTVKPPMPTRLAKTLAFLRTYKLGRVVLRMQLVRGAGQWLLKKVRS
jgi:hypothetical protein